MGLSGIGWSWVCLSLGGFVCDGFVVRWVCRWVVLSGICLFGDGFFGGAEFVFDWSVVCVCRMIFILDCCTFYVAHE